MLETELERSAGVAENAPTEALLSNRTPHHLAVAPALPSGTGPNRVVMQ
jgi:hypothetical protein